MAVSACGAGNFYFLQNGSEIFFDVFELFLQLGESVAFALDDVGFGAGDKVLIVEFGLGAPEGVADLVFLFLEAVLFGLAVDDIGHIDFHVRGEGDGGVGGFGAIRDGVQFLQMRQIADDMLLVGDNVAVGLIGFDIDLEGLTRGDLVSGADVADGADGVLYE